MADWKDSIVLLTSTDPGNDGFGTGFVFHSDRSGRRYVLTCQHVVDSLVGERPREPDAPTLIEVNGKSAEILLQGDDVLDLAVLSVDKLEVEPLALGKRPAARGLRIESAGYTNAIPGENKSATNRPLSGTVRDNNPVRIVRQPGQARAWYLDLELDPDRFRALEEGYSGSPVYDPNTGTVVGCINIKRSGAHGHAVCIKSCANFNPPLEKRLLDYPPDQGRCSPAAASGTPDWLASTMDHLDHLQRLTSRLDGRRGFAFITFEACLNDCPRAFAEHLALEVNAWRSFPGTLSPGEFLTVLAPTRYDAHGLWGALVDHVTPPDAFGRQATEEIDRILHWMNQGSPTGRPMSRILYCELDMAGLGSSIPDFIAGAIADFTRLHSLRPEVQVLFVFACLYQETGLGRFRLLNRFRVPRWPRHEQHLSLGALTVLRQVDIEHWLDKLERGGHPLDRGLIQHLRNALEPLFPTDAVRVRYRRARRAAISILNPAVCAATPGDRP